MTPPIDGFTENKGLRSYPWSLSYKTSSTMIDGRPVDMLRDFYLPALKLAVRYDRVAGYFRSTSLAAASQGFSAFVGRGGKMRLIVGTDLDPEDVKAILDGDSRRLEARLNGELEQAESWPEDVRNGVTLLAWMVAHDHLEVRVAFRLHRVTGEPLRFEDVDDGYVHEKWFILYDEFGNRLYGSGTLNESKTALTLNAENIDVHCDWWGEIERRRVEEAAEAFENLWMGRVPHLPVMTLPEAVRRKLIRFAEGIDRPVEVDGSSAAPEPVEAVPPAIERLWFAVLRDAPKMPGGRFVGMETAPVAPWPHQAVVVRRLVETWPYSYLLCDEVGLGKTIEAGLAFRSLYLAGLVKRILIAAPASLTTQWQRQMATKMLMSFGRARTSPGVSHEYIFPAPAGRPAHSLYEPDLVIVSTGLLARRERARELANAKPFDVALVDEAHAARRRNPAEGVEAHPDYGYLYLALRDDLRKRARSLWLATATPMQIHPVEVCDLLALTNRVGGFQFDPTLTLKYYEILDSLVRGQDPNEQEWDFLRRAVRAISFQDPVLWKLYEDHVIDGRMRSAARRWLESGRVPRGRDRQSMLRLIFSASPLARVMLRHTRKLLEVYRDHGQLKENLPQRHVLPLRAIAFNPLERRVYDRLEAYLKGLATQLTRQGNRQNRQMVSFLLSFLRLRFASSLYAFKVTLERRLHKVEETLRYQAQQLQEGETEESSLEDAVYEAEDEDDMVAVESLLQHRTKEDLEWERSKLTEMLESLGDLKGPSSKMMELLKILDNRKDRETGRIRQTVIFTRFYDTLTDIVARLRQVAPEMRLGTYSGKGAERYDPDRHDMVGVEREEVKERFLRGEIDVLVCTDAAAEGLNLQTADLLVNFDLGWNPMKIEQRIGRIDRIGQRHAHIYVQNLCYAGSVEEIVYDRLLTRLAQANLIVGTQQISLLPVEPDEFRQLAEGTLTLEELEDRARERLEQQRNRTQSMEMDPKELYEIYRRLAQEPVRHPVPVDLEAIWEALSRSRYLRAIGCSVKEVSGEPVLVLSGIAGIEEGVLLTTSRKLYEEGVPEEGTRVHFASYGDPFFDAVLKHMERFELPACVRRITVSVPGPDGSEMVAYAAICRGANGTREVRLVRSWDDLREVCLLEEEALTDPEIEPLRQQLAEAAQEEFAFYPVAERVERFNERAGRLHEWLNFHVIRNLLDARALASREKELFWPILREVESLFETREQILVDDLPVEVLRRFQDDWLFDAQVPTVGHQAHVVVPRIIAQAAIDAAKRVADSMKRQRNELRLRAILERLESEAEQRMKRIFEISSTPSNRPSTAKPSLLWPNAGTAGHDLYTTFNT